MVEFQITFAQMVIRILRHGIFSTNDFIEFGNRFAVFFLLIIGITQLIKIGVGPLSVFSFVSQ